MSHHVAIIELGGCKCVAKVPVLEHIENGDKVKIDSDGVFTAEAKCLSNDIWFSDEQIDFLKNLIGDSFSQYTIVGRWKYEEFYTAEETKNDA